MYQTLGDDQQPWTPPAPPETKRPPGSTMPYAEAREAWERRQIDERAIKDAYARDCAGRRLFERLERDPGTAETRVKRFEKRLSEVVPRLFSIKRAQDARMAVLKQELASGAVSRDSFQKQRANMARTLRIQIDDEYGRGYVLGTEQEELANARCALSKARWELMTKQNTGRVPGRLHGPGLGQPPIHVSEEAFIEREIKKGTPTTQIADGVFWGRNPQWKGVRLPKDCNELAQLHGEWRRARAIVQARQTGSLLRVP